MATARPRRRWYQFSLLSLLVFTTLTALLVARYSIPAWRQREAVAWIIAAGGEVNYDHEFTSAAYPPGPIWLRETIGDDFFQRVAQVQFAQNFDTEEELHEALVQVARLPKIDHLEIRSRAGITEANLQVIARQRTLKSLHLFGPTPDAGLAHLTKLDKLLRLSVHDVTDSTLTQIAKLRSLERLYLEGSITDDGLAHLGSLSELQELIYDRGHVAHGLENTVNGTYTDVSLRDLIGFLQNESNTTLGIDQEALAAKGVSMDELLVTGSANGITLRQSLDNVLTPHGLGFRIDKEELVITTREEVDRARAGTRALQKKLPKLKVISGW